MPGQWFSNWVPWNLKLPWWHPPGQGGEEEGQRRSEDGGPASQSCLKPRHSAFICLAHWASPKDSSGNRNGSLAIFSEPLEEWENIQPVRLVKWWEIFSLKVDWICILETAKGHLEPRLVKKYVSTRNNDRIKQQ